PRADSRAPVRRHDVPPRQVHPGAAPGDSPGHPVQPGPPRRHRRLRPGARTRGRSRAGGGAGTRGRAMTSPEPSDLGRFEPTPYDFGVTDAAIEDPDADLLDVYLAAEAEEALYAQVFTGPCDPEPEPPEIEP